MPEAAGSKVNADPNSRKLIVEDIDIVVAASDGAQLLTRHLLQRSEGANPPFVAIEERVVYAFVIPPAHAQANDANNLVHDRRNAVLYVREGRVRKHRLIPAADVKPHARGADRIPVGSDASDGHRVAFMMIGHHGNLVGGLGASLDLSKRALVYGSSPNGDAVSPLHGRAPSAARTPNGVVPTCGLSVGR